MRTIEEVIQEISDNAQYRNGEPTYLFEGYDVEKALCEILEIHKKERQQGEWKLDSIGAYCSECGTYPDYTTDFCPKCGAAMREGTTK